MVFLLLATVIMAPAQTTTANMTGEYYLQGVMETASGFKLNADSTFEFFFIYGALDRYGSGNWQAKGNSIIFNSRPRPPKDFALRVSKTVTANQITIKMVDVNPQAAQYVSCRIQAGQQVITQRMNSHGEAVIPWQAADTISLVFEWCADRPSVFAIDNKKHNYFEFAFEPWIAEVFFEQFVLQFEQSQLIGKHPLLTGTSYIYKGQ